MGNLNAETLGRLLTMPPGSPPTGAERGGINFYGPTTTPPIQPAPIPGGDFNALGPMSQQALGLAGIGGPPPHVGPPIFNVPPNKGPAGLPPGPDLGAPPPFSPGGPGIKVPTPFPRPPSSPPVGFGPNLMPNPGMIGLPGMSPPSFGGGFSGGSPYVSPAIGGIRDRLRGLLDQN